MSLGPLGLSLGSHSSVGVDERSDGSDDDDFFGIDCCLIFLLSSSVRGTSGSRGEATGEAKSSGFFLAILRFFASIFLRMFESMTSAVSSDGVLVGVSREYSERCLSEIFMGRLWVGELVWGFSCEEHDERSDEQGKGC